MSKLGEKLRELRGNESLREASNKIGISHTYLDTLEKGYDKRSGKPSKPTPETLKLISKAYDYPYEEYLIIYIILLWGARGRRFESCFPDMQKVLT